MMKKLLLGSALLLTTLSLAQGGSAFSVLSAIDSPGSQDRILQTDIASNLALNGAYTLEAWIKVPSTSDGYIEIISTAAFPNPGGYSLNLFNDKVGARVYGVSGQQGAEGNTSVTYDSWQHVSATYDGVDELKLYLNGTLDGTFNLGIDNLTLSADLFIGGAADGSANNESFLIDEVRIWEDVRTNQEIIDNMNTCLTGNESDLVLYYDMESSSNGIINDICWHNYDGNILNEQTNALVQGVFSCCSIDLSTSTNNNIITATLSDPGTSYQWIDCTNSNQLINGETSQSYTPTTNGDYACIINDGACSDTTDCVSITTLSINENYLNKMNIFPNPTSDQLNIEIEDNIEEVIIFDMFGSLVQKEFTKSFSVENLISGVYLINVKTNEGIIRKRFVKQ